MAKVKQRAYAKINLTLEVVGQSEGYHLLDSFVASVDLFDVVTVKKRKDKQCTVRMRGLGSEEISTEKNNAWKAAKMFCEKYDVNGVDVTIEKNIPMGAGLGGSSADTAGTLNALAKLYKIMDEEGLDEIADALGSDSRYMLRGGFARMQGRGNRCYYLGEGEPLHFLMVCPLESVSTKRCFEAFDGVEKNPSQGYTAKAIDAYTKGDKEALGKSLYNDLYVPAQTLCSAIGQAYERLKALSPLGVTMTGSGSCVLALFENEEFCRYAKSRYQGDEPCFVVKTV